MMTPQPIRVLGITQPLCPTSLARLQSAFHTVHYHPSSPLPPDILPEIEALFVPITGLPEGIASFRSLPRLRHVQLASAGADKLLQHAAIREYATWSRSGEGDGGGAGVEREGGSDGRIGNGAKGTDRAEVVGRSITVSTASGIHVVSIPNWVVANLIGIYHQLPRVLQIAREQARWSTGNEISPSGKPYVARSTRGRTAGMLGYGSLGRETARLLKAHGMRIVAANTSGKATPQDGYILPGTGDPTGSIPSVYYSTRSPSSFADFLRVCDVLVCTLPNTRDTAYLLNEEKLALLPKDAVFINVGRGNLVRSDHLLSALSHPTRPLLGAALDVTDPEPLPPSHPLWTHSRCIVTPHLSGDAEGEFELATDVLLHNLERIERGERPVNLVDLSRGY